MKTLQSFISSVTVFSDRAQVNRLANIELDAGEHRLLFDYLPASLDRNTVQVQGKGKAVLREIKPNTVHYSDITDEQIKTLHETRQQLSDQQAQINQRLAHIEKQKQLLDGIVKRVTHTPENLQHNDVLDTDKWAGMMHFQREQLSNLDAEAFDYQKQLRELRKQLETIELQISQSGGATHKTRNAVEVLVDVQERSMIVLQLSYVTTGASWSPVYDFRVSSENKKVSLTYNAIVRQHTGENWNDVQLLLSTARPSVQGNQPELHPWHINFYEPVMYAASPMLARSEAAKSKKSTRRADIEEFADMLMDKDEAEIMEQNVALAETQATSVLFVVAGKHSIATDNRQHNVTITIVELAADFRYSSVPKLSSFAYLRAKVRNTTDFPLLAGATNIFLDQTFVAQGSISTIAPTEEFWTSLGIDEGIKIERKFLRKYRKDEGIFSKKAHLLFEYMIVVKNNKRTDEEIVIQDQLPISGNKEISVSLIDPKYKEDTATLKKLMHEVIEWTIKLKAGEKIELPFKFDVEYPQEKTVTGLD